MTYVYVVLPQVEAGDVILKVNETDVNRLSTKEGKQFYPPLIMYSFVKCQCHLAGRRKCVILIFRK
jgi:hypothetical protein